MIYPNISYLNIGSNRASLPSTDYIWMDGFGETTSLLNPNEFIVLREGIHGFSGVSDERSVVQSPNEYAEMVNHRISKSREFGFDILIIGSSYYDIMTKRGKLMKIFSIPGALRKQMPDGNAVTIHCYAARGSPSISGGLPKGNLATHQIASLSLIAPDPYWYGGEITVNRPAGSNSIQLINSGNAGFTPCEIVLSANSARNRTTNQEIHATSGKSVVGVTVKITDNGVSAELNGSNVIGRFDMESEFFGLAPGVNVIEGVSSVKYTPRWDGI